MSKRILVGEIFKKNLVDIEVNVKGWVRSVRKSKAFCFVVLNDGSGQDNLQIVVDAKLSNYEDLSSLLIGSSASFTGRLVKSGGKGQNIEMQATSGEVIGRADETYPIQKKGTSLEFLREQAHFRPRTNAFGAIFRIRHVLAQATHQFFSERGFYYLNSPIITGVDGEGAGEMFRVSTLDPNKPPRTEKGDIDFSQDYFGKETSLCVTGQLEAECFALGMGAVYTFGPTFRAENSHTARHLSEFWMIEPEVAFADLEDVAALASDYVKFLIDSAFKHCDKEMEFLKQWPLCDMSDEYRKTLEHVRDSEFVKITYTEAIDILSKSKVKFEFPTNWGSELQTEHERYLTEKHFKMPVIVTDYPKDFKAFYMKLNSDNKTVRAMDVLVPGIGEIIGGSQREDDLGVLERRMKEVGLNKDLYWWYLDLRRFGSVPHAGFGLGFERVIQYITGVSNIRDVIPFPRTPKNCDF